MYNRSSPLHHQASLRYDDIEQVGPAAHPLDFPATQVHRGCHVSFMAKDHKTGRIHQVKGVLMQYSACCNSTFDETSRAYLLRKKIAKSTYGSIRLCVVLRRLAETYRSEGRTADWESTDEVVIVKASSWARIRKGRGKNIEDPLKEASALQFVGNYHKHIQSCHDVLQDEEYLYVVTPFYQKGDLYAKILGSYWAGNQKNLMQRVNEAQARVWFRQLLQCLLHLQQKGMCHRDISLENLMLDADNDLVLIDFGLALRVPYDDSSNYGCVADVSEGYCRRLITNQGQSGNLTYLAPEVVEAESEFDGFAVDLWSAGIVLFIFLVGMAPFEWAHATDYRFTQINKGRLGELLKSMNMQISDEACHLLQNMLWRNPRKRLTLAQVLSHPWVREAGTGGQHLLWEGSEELEEDYLEAPRSFFFTKSPVSVPTRT